MLVKQAMDKTHAVSMFAPSVMLGALMLVSGPVYSQTYAEISEEYEFSDENPSSGGKGDKAENDVNELPDYSASSEDDFFDEYMHDF